MIDTIFIYERLDYLISTGKTGTRKELAKKFNVSERTVSRWVEFMKTHGAEITYSRHKRSFVYSNPGKFSIVIQFKAQLPKQA
jgi:transposase